MEENNEHGAKRAAVVVAPSLLVQQTEKLLGSLQHAFEEPSGTGTEQDRYMLALRGVAEFLDAIGANGLYGTRFGELAMAIGDLERGTVDPVLTPIRFGSGRAADPSTVWVRRGYVALAVEALVMTGMERKAAAKDLVRRFPPIADLSRARNPDRACDAALSWYESFRRGQVKHRVAATVYANLHKMMLEAIGSDRVGLERSVARFLQEAFDNPG